MQVQKKKFEDIRKPLEQMGYEPIKSIGKGAFGEVILVKNNETEQLFAVKVINRLQIKKKPFLQKYIDQEIEIMKKLTHPNIVRHQHSFSTPDFIVIIMEYCEQGNLLTYQARLPGRTFALDHAIEIVVEVMKGLKCIHEKNFIHRDIKSQNVLLKKVDVGDGFKIEYKIADFGFARSIGGVGAKTHCGTEKYMAPEIINNAYYGISVDLWAVGVLLYFMLFAEYPFRGHDMRADIQRKCTPAFNVTANLTKRDKLDIITPELQDFFRQIFVLNSKRRITFSNIVKHSLFSKHHSQFEENAAFYSEHEKKEEFRKDEVEKNVEYGFQSEMEAEDQTRTYLMRKKEIANGVKHLERELEEINFEIRKVIYLKECAIELYENYSSCLTYAERLGARFYLLKAFLFYCDPLLQKLQAKKMPESLSHANIDARTWQQCTKTDHYRGLVIKLQQEQLKSQFTFEETYVLIQNVIGTMPMDNFKSGYSLAINEKSFDEMKKSYRSTTAYIFRAIEYNRRLDPHLRNKIKIRLFCCHMINRIFDRADIEKNFPYFISWLQRKKITYPYTFDFLYFKRWILEEDQENLGHNISHLHKIFF